MRIGVACTAAFALAGCGLDEVRLDRPPTHDWIEVTSPHFRVQTDTAESFARSVIEQYERQRELLARIAFPTWQAPADRLDVVIFEDSDEFGAISPSGFGAYYQETRHGAVTHARIVAPAGSNYMTSVTFGRTTMVHELVHRFVSANRPFVPTWLNEGLAQYYETLEEDRSTHEVILGEHAPTGSLIADWSAVAYLIGASPEQFYNEKKMSANYSAAWGLVHFLIHHPGERARLDCLLWQRDGRESVVDAERRCLRTDDPRTLDVAVRSYFEGTPSLGVRVPAPPFAPSPTLTMRKMSVVEVLRLRATALTWDIPAAFERAKSIIGRAAQLAPDDPETQLLLAEVWQREGRPDLREAALRKAVASRPDEPRFLVSLAAALVARFPSQPTTEKAAEIAALLDRVVALPCPAEVLAFAAKLSALQPDRMDRALDLARKAVAEAPGCASCHATLAEILVKKGETPLAIDELTHAIALQPDGRASNDLLALERRWKKAPATVK
jgi:tetratricopeptide (TPR) repeat protein